MSRLPLTRPLEVLQVLRPLRATESVASVALAVGAQAAREDHAGGAFGKAQCSW